MQLTAARDEGRRAGGTALSPGAAHHRAGTRWDGPAEGWRCVVARRSSTPREAAGSSQPPPPAAL